MKLLTLPKISILVAVVSLTLSFQNCAQQTAADGNDIADGLATTATAAANQACTITNSSGQTLLANQDDSTDCEAACATESNSFPNLMCNWNETDITPEAECVISATTGVVMASGVTTRMDCSVQCSNYATTSGERCSWNGSLFTN